jgi:hypothetical protein
MTEDHENKLRRVLREESADVQPAPGAWEQIEFRAAKARRRGWASPRAYVALSTAAAVLVGVVAVATLRGNGSGTDVEAGPADTPVTTPAPDPAGAAGPGIWPFRTGAEADAVSTDDWNDPVFTAERFLRDYAGFSRLLMGDFAQGDARSGEVTATTRNLGPVTTVFVRRLGSRAEGPWTVVGATSENIILDRPTAMEKVASPVHIEGRSTAFEGNVVVEVREDNQIDKEGELGLTPLTGGSMGEFGPLVGDVPFGATTASGGAVVAYTSSAMDGAVEEVAAVRVLFAGAADGQENRLIAFDEGTGKLVAIGNDGKPARTLAAITPGTTFAGFAVSPDRKTAFLAEVPGDDDLCSAIAKPVSLDGQAADTPAVMGRWPAFSPDGKRLAVAADSDCDGSDELLIRDLTTGSDQRFPDVYKSPSPDGLTIRLSHLTWAPDGRSIAYEVSDLGGTGAQVHDITDPGAVTGNAFEPPLDGHQNSWLRPAFTPSGTLTVTAADNEPSIIETIDPGTGDPVGRGSRDAGVPIRMMTWRGRDLIVVSTNGSVHQLVDGELRKVADGDYAAAG